MNAETRELIEAMAKAVWESTEDASWADAGDSAHRYCRTEATAALRALQDAGYVVVPREAPPMYAATGLKEEFYPVILAASPISLEGGE